MHPLNMLETTIVKMLSIQLKCKVKAMPRQTITMRVNTKLCHKKLLYTVRCMVETKCSSNTDMKAEPNHKQTEQQYNTCQHMK